MKAPSRSIKTFQNIKSSLSHNRGSIAGIGVTLILILFSLTLLLCYQGVLIAKENKVRIKTYLCIKTIEKLYAKTDKRIDILNKTILTSKALLLTPLHKAARISIKAAKFAQESIFYHFLTKSISLEGCSKDYSIHGFLKFPFKTIKKLKLQRENDLAIRRTKPWETEVYSRSVLLKRTFKISTNISYEKGKLLFLHKEEKLLSSVLSGLPYVSL